MKTTTVKPDLYLDNKGKWWFRGHDVTELMKAFLRALRRGNDASFIDFDNQFIRAIDRTCPRPTGQRTRVSELSAFA